MFRQQLEFWNLADKLTEILGKLVREGRLSEEELRGLEGDKVESIRSYAKFLATLAAVA